MIGNTYRHKRACRSFIGALLALALAGCQVSASTAPVPKSTVPELKPTAPVPVASVQPPMGVYGELREKLPPFAQAMLLPELVTPDAVAGQVDCSPPSGAPGASRRTVVCLAGYATGMELRDVVDRLGTELASRYPVVSVPPRGDTSTLQFVFVYSSTGTFRAHVASPLPAWRDVTLWMSEDFVAADVAAGGAPPELPDFVVPADATYIDGNEDETSIGGVFVLPREPEAVLADLETGMVGRGLAVEQNVPGTILVHANPVWVVTVSQRVGGGSVLTVALADA